MKISNSLIAAAVVALLPLAAVAGDKAKTPAPTGTVASAQFDTLDANRDGRISPAEAAIDAKIKFTSTDKNSDGYLDAGEFEHRDIAVDPMTDSGNPAKGPAQPRE